MSTFEENFVKNVVNKGEQPDCLWARPPEFFKEGVEHFKESVAESDIEPKDIKYYGFITKVLSEDFKDEIINRKLTYYIDGCIDKNYINFAVDNILCNLSEDSLIVKWIKDTFKFKGMPLFELDNCTISGKELVILGVVSDEADYIRE